MKHPTWILTFLLVAGLTVGCTSSKAKNTAGPAPPAVARALSDNARAGADDDVAQGTQDHAYARKDKFVDRMQTGLVELQWELDRLSADVGRASVAVKADAEAALAAVRAQWAQANRQLAQAEAATESGWDDVRGRIQKSYDDLNESVVKARRWLGEEFAP
jgi:hypothetical protein